MTQLLVLGLVFVWYSIRETVYVFVRMFTSRTCLERETDSLLENRLSTICAVRDQHIYILQNNDAAEDNKQINSKYLKPNSSFVN